MSTAQRYLRGRLVAAFLAFALLVQPLQATWSIVVVDMQTGEVAVGCCTCLPGSIHNLVPVIYPGVGAGAAQSAIDLNAKNRKKIWAGFQDGSTPREILDIIQQTDAQIQSRQFGIVDLWNTPVTFTGSQAGPVAGGVVGEVGTLKYAIQGNVLTCPSVWLDAETALLNAPGDLSQKVMAAMEAARAVGGDGRCSCLLGGPDACGCVTVPPFKSAHTGFVILARIGDALGVCTGQTGCSNGTYWLKLNVPGNTSDPIDPVVKLQAQYDLWRASMSGVPDQLKSIVRVGSQSLPADGVTKTWVDFELRDLDGVPITHGGHTVQFSSANGTTPVTSLTPLVDHGNGSYTFEIQAGLQTGSDLWRISVSAGNTLTVLQPDVAIRVDPATSFHSGYDWVSSSGGAPAPLWLDLGAQHAGESYLILASLSGTQPGIQIGGGVTLPLNFDSFLRRSLSSANTFVFQNTAGTLDASGRAEARFNALPDALAPLIGQHIDFAGAILTPNAAASVADGFDVLP